MYTPGTLFDGRYLLKEQKGRGSFGEVWLATDQQVGVDFAVKIYVAMNTKGLDDFRKEYQLSCNLINSNLLHINHMGVCQQDSCPYLVMPYCPRGSSSYVGNIDEPTLWKFLHDVANGLAYLHNQNPPIVHQDIKPDNILQTKNGDFVITDFGISKQMRATLSSTGNDSSGAIAYMGPERFGRQYQTIKSSDIWSLGATLYELASGLLPFEGRGGAMMNAGAEAPDLPGMFSSELNEIVRSCMAKEPWDRPSASQLVEMADQFLKGGRIPAVKTAATTAQATSAPVSTPTPVSALAGAPAPVIPSPSKSKTPIFTVCAIVALVLIGFIAYMLIGGDGKKPAGSTTATVSQSAVKPSAPVASSPVVNEPNTNTMKEEANKQEPLAATASAIQKTEKKEIPATTVSHGTVNVGNYATWTGSLKNGKPHGQGTMTFTRDYDLQGHDIKAGDTVKGECSNGNLIGFCKWHGSAGDKSILLGE